MSRFTRPLAALIVGAALAFAAPAFAQADLGPVAEQIVPGTEGVWTATLTDAGAVLENNDSPGAVRYYRTDASRATFGRRTITAEVQITESTAASRVGLLYGQTQDASFYYMFVIEADGVVALYRRDESGVTAMFSTGTAGSSRGEVNTLQIVEEGDVIQLYVNGQNVAGFGSDGIGEGGVGIVAWGTGTYLVSSYEETVAD